MNELLLNHHFVDATLLILNLAFATLPPAVGKIAANKFKLLTAFVKTTPFLHIFEEVWLGYTFTT